jgi:DNA-binding YbaB/EbfC family protein
MMEGLDLRGLMDAWQKIQDEVHRTKETLGNKTVTAETGGGMVRCIANGKTEILSITIDPALFTTGDKKLIEDLTVGAVNLAIERAQGLAQEAMAQATAGLPLPAGLFKG